MEWLALIIPVISCVVAYVWYRDMFAIWEYIIPIAASALVILICKFCVKTSMVSDTEYWGSLVVKARYYEYWETWVDQTCTRTYECNCSTDSDGRETCQTCTETYDCSYCDRNGEYWEVYDDAGNSWQVSESYWKYIVAKWKSNPQFVDMHRDIDNHGGCGKDGDMYEVNWNGQIETSEAAVTDHSYTNRVQASHSSFKLPHISEKEAKQSQLYKYPPKYDYYKQKVILGLDSIYGGAEKEDIETYFQYFNGFYGKKNKVKLFVCLFYDKPLGISYKQEAYWDGGNQNELVVCIGMDKQKNLQWVRAFSWTDHKRVAIDIREDIMGLGTFQPYNVYGAIQMAVSENVMYKDFKTDFSYLTVDLPGWSYWLIWIMTLLSTGGVWWWCFKNEFEANYKIQ